MTRINVAFSDPQLVDELRQRVPPRHRSEFIAAAVREKLAQLRQEEAVRATCGVWADEGRPDPDEEIRMLRGQWEREIKPKGGAGASKPRGGGRR